MSKGFKAGKYIFYLNSGDILTRSCNTKDEFLSAINVALTSGEGITRIRFER